MDPFQVIKVYVQQPPKVFEKKSLQKYEKNQRKKEIWRKLAPSTCWLTILPQKIVKKKHQQSKKLTIIHFIKLISYFIRH